MYKLCVCCCFFQENLKALRARDKAAERIDSEKESEKRQEIFNEGKTLMNLSDTILTKCNKISVLF